MSSFTEPLTLTVVDKKRRMVSKTFRYYIGNEDSDRYVEVPMGFVTDGSSIPRIFWWISHPLQGDHVQCGVLHDYIYRVNKVHTPVGIVPVDRYTGDHIFLEAMEVMKVFKLKRRLMYRAVRLFAGGVWARYRKSETYIAGS